MKFLFFALLLSVSFLANSQKLVENLRWYDLGRYEGEIPSYSIHTDTAKIEVQATPITILIKKDSVYMELGTIEKSGSYRVLFKGDGYYVVDAFFEGDIHTERLVFYRGKLMVREGLNPQPNTELKRKGRN